MIERLDAHHSEGSEGRVRDRNGQAAYSRRANLSQSVSLISLPHALYVDVSATCRGLSHVARGDQYGVATGAPDQPNL